MAAAREDVSARDMSVLLTSSDDEQQVAVQARPRKFVPRSVVFASILLLAAVVAVVGRAQLWKTPQAAATESEQFVSAASVESGQAHWQIVVKERDICSKTKENCMSSKCCKVSGYHCYRQSATEAKCMKTCDPKTSSCEALSRPLELITGAVGRNLYCFSVYTANTGSPKASHEKELLTQQFAEKVSIFACNKYAVYSDVAVSLGGGLNTIKVDDVDNEFHFAKRKETGAWVNTGMFVQVWKAIAEANTYMDQDWVVKADPDAVFVPKRLQDRIQSMPRTVSGVFLQNCRYVDYGFFGSLEIFSKQAFNILIANIDVCRAQLPWKVGIKGGKYGPMGEDLFAEVCMEKNGVDKLEAFDVTTDGACPGDRPLDQAKNKKWRANCAQTITPAMHPFKKPADYFACLKATMKAAP